MHSKLFYLFLLFLKYVGCDHIESFFFDFEQTKYDLFEESYLKMLKNESESINSGQINKCLTDLKAIQDGLIAREQWALQSKILKIKFMFKSYDM